MPELGQGKGREIGTFISVETLRIFVSPCNEVLKNKRFLYPTFKNFVQDK